MTKTEGRKENGDLWGNARRSSKKGQNMMYIFHNCQNIPEIYFKRYRGQGEARETLKAAMKNRPPVAEIVKEITKVL